MSEPGRVLTADLGGTRARVAVFSFDAGRPRLECQVTYLSKEFPDAVGVVRRFLADEAPGPLAAGCVGVAGAVHGNRSWLTNLGWDVDGAALGEALGAPVELVNDLVATALGMACLGPGDLLDLNPGAAEPDGNGVLLGAGTGLGMALLVWSGERMLAVPSEGGHVDLAPRDEEGWRLRQFLAARLGGRVSVERVISGMGLRNLYDFLLADGMVPSPEVVRRMGSEDPGRVVGEAGLARSCPLCTRALELFAGFFGAFAGDMALLMAARGGVYLGGGVSLRLADKLADGTFQRAFLDKGRLSYFVERVPVHAILRTDTALWGAARRAGELAG